MKIDLEAISRQVKKNLMESLFLYEPEEIEATRKGDSIEFRCDERPLKKRLRIEMRKMDSIFFRVTYPIGDWFEAFANNCKLHQRLYPALARANIFLQLPSPMPVVSKPEPPAPKQPEVVPPPRKIKPVQLSFPF